MLEVLVCGAGSAGLTVAACLARAGHRVLVLERKGELSTQGGGISIRPAAYRSLAYYGLDAALESVSQISVATRLYDIQTGELLRTLPNPSTHKEWATQRSDLQRALFAESIRLGVVVRFNCGVQNVVDETDQRPYVVLDDGKKEFADLIIAADGARSRLRSFILPRPVELKVSETAFYGVALPARELREKAETRDLVSQDDLTVHMGKGIYLVSRLHTVTDTYWCLFGIPERAQGAALWNEHGDIEKVRDTFRGATTSVRTLLDLAERAERWQLTEVPDLPTWRSSCGRAILLADAAHAMEPNAAQGISLSIEDAAVLTYLVTLFGKEEIARATEAWEAIRKPRVENVKAFAARQTKIFIDAPVLTSKQPEAPNPSETIKPDPHARQSSRAYAKWLYDYDPIGETQDMLRTVKPPMQVLGTPAKL